MEISGPAWCAMFPTSESLEDLCPAFRSDVAGFIGALRAGGASVSIAATYRPPQRAYLMHWACMIGTGGQDPAAIPVMPGVEIDWTHGGDRVSAKAAAKAMMAGYNIAFPAALVSRHTQRRAIDMTIHVPAGATIIPHLGLPVRFAESCDGMDPRLHAIGKTFGVIKLVSDRPHWSDDGH
jgi:D-alanyl-D-alanine dipeptidase